MNKHDLGVVLDKKLEAEKNAAKARTAIWISYALAVAVLIMVFALQGEEIAARLMEALAPLPV